MKSCILRIAAAALAVISFGLPVGAAGVMQYSGNDIEIISRAVAASYSDEGFGAKVGICAVIMNRVGKAGFPDSVAAVISSADSGFDSEALAGDIDEKALRIARDACLAAASGADPTGGALYFEKIPAPSLSDNHPEFEKSVDVSKYSAVIGGVGFY